MQCQMYHLKPLDKSIRTEFRLPFNPYFDDEDGEEAIEYLRGLGVFFYRDEENSEGILITPHPHYCDGTGVRVEVPVEDWGGFLAYKSACDLNFDLESQEEDEFEDIEVVTWERPKREYVKKWGDDRAWLNWNEQLQIVRVEPVRVVTS